MQKNLNLRIFFSIIAIAILSTTLVNCNKSEKKVDNLSKSTSFIYQVIDSIGNILAIKRIKSKTDKEYLQYFKNSSMIKFEQRASPKIYYQKKGSNDLFKLLDNTIIAAKGPGGPNSSPCGSSQYNYKATTTFYGINNGGGMNLDVTVNYTYDNTGKYVSSGYSYQIWGSGAPSLVTIASTSMAGYTPNTTQGTTLLADIYGYYGSTTTGTSGGGIQGSINGQLNFPGVGSVGANAGANYNGSMSTTNSSNNIGKLSLNVNFDPCAKTFRASKLTWELQAPL